MNAAQILSDLKSDDGTVNCMGDFLTHFVESYPYSSHVREARTSKYLLANYREATSNGLESIDDLIGATAREIWIDDVLHRRKKLNLDSSIIQSEYKNTLRIEEFEKQLLFTKRPVSFNCLYVYFQGIIALEKLTKIPISDRDNKKIISFLTVFQDLTPQLPLQKLFDLYHMLFPFSKQKAIQHLLRHLELDSHFNPLSPLTYRETQILLAMHEDSRCKILAQKFDVSTTTMSNHIAHIQEKIVSPFALHHVLSKLRTVGEKTFMEEL